MGNIKLTIINKKSFKMKYLLSVVSLAVLANSKPQLSFGSGSSDDANPRLGLLATNLGLSPTAETEGRTGSLEEFLELQVLELLQLQLVFQLHKLPLRINAVVFQLIRTVLTSMLSKTL